MGLPTGLDDKSKRSLKAQQDNNYKSRLDQYEAPGLDPIQTKFARELLVPDTSTAGITLVYEHPAGSSVVQIQNNDLQDE